MAKLIRFADNAVFCSRDFQATRGKNLPSYNMVVGKEPTILNNHLL
jgi:hypothetical protein